MFDYQVSVVRKNSKLKVIVLFLLVILLGGSAVVSIMVSGIIIGATVLGLLGLLALLALVSWLKKKRN
jgi:hypothetical protein